MEASRASDALDRIGSLLETFRRRPKDVSDEDQLVSIDEIRGFGSRVTDDGGDGGGG